MKEINLLKREIKFRAWDKAGKRMIYSKEWREGDDYYVISLLIDDIGWSVWKIKEYSSLKERELLVNYKTGILMQFTGLKDKNGKEIYEGDILEYKNTGAWGRFVVKWDKRGFWDCGIDYKNSKIIGNLFENPELLRDN